MKIIFRFLCVVFCLSTTANPLVAQWIQTNGPAGGEVYSFAVSGANLYAGSYGGGVFLTTNNGTSWTAFNTGLTNTRVHVLAISGTNFFAGTSGGVFLSTSNGTNWIAVNTGLTNTNVWAFAISGANLFAGTFGGVFLSTNNGTSWTAVNTGLSNTNVAALAVSGTNLFAATAGGGVFLSTNNGSSWAAVNTGLSNTYVPALAVFPSSSGTNLFAGTYSGIFLSTNNGTTWTIASTGSMGDVFCAFTISGTNLFAGSAMNGIFLSTNNGTSWTPVSFGFAPSGAWALAVYGPYLFAGTLNGGVWRRPMSEMVTSTPVESIRFNSRTQYSLSQNYPNPFNSSTTIRYALPHSARVKLAIYDLLGREIEMLVDEQQEAEWRNVQWDASGFPSGIYFYRLQAGSYSSTKKLILLK